MRAAVVVGGFAGCVGIGGGDGVAPSGPAAELPDARVEALGGCTARDVRLDEDGAIFSVVDRVWNDDGDQISFVTTFPDGDLWAHRLTWSAPHALAEEAIDAPGTADDAIERFTWEPSARGDRMATYEQDLGADGVIDLLERLDWTADGLWDTIEWHLDRDGSADQTLTYAWAPTDTGWHGVGAGAYAGGPFTTVANADRSAFVTDFRSEEPGFVNWWSRTPPNALGYSAHEEDGEDDGSSVTVELLDQTFDDAGRIVEDRWERTITGLGVEQRTVLVTDRVYDCG
ncbi:MAG: hypothetical protein ABMB14_36145 [Myxococcota bacterium]